MCGLTGYLSRTAAPDGVLQGMTGALEHRGPDDEGYYRDGPLAFGFRRLSIIDVAGSPQPMRTPDGDLACVFNGEIYNFATLRRELQARGHAFRTNGDTETLLYAYREYGVRMLEHLQGMFAFALWDRRAQRLLIARDHLGVKPLYYHWDGATLVFGSELKALLPHPAVGRELDLDALGLYLESQFIPSPATVYRNVRKLEPGHRLLVEGGKLSVERYWLPDYSQKLELSEDEALSRLEAELRRSVQSMLVSDVPLGSFLSGGVDSSLVSALMVDIAKRPIDTFTLGFHGRTAASEHAHAEVVSRHIGSTNHVLMLDPSDLLSGIDSWVDAFDEPFADPAALPTMFLAQLARRHVTVVLTGEGADEVFSGYGNYRKRVSEERISRVLGARLSPLRYVVRALPPRLRKDRLLKAIGEPLGAPLRHDSHGVRRRASPAALLGAFPRRAAHGNGRLRRALLRGMQFAGVHRQADVHRHAPVAAGRPAHQGGSRDHGAFAGSARALPRSSLLRVLRAPRPGAQAARAHRQVPAEEARAQAAAARDRRAAQAGLLPAAGRMVRRSAQG